MSVSTLRGAAQSLIRTGVAHARQTAAPQRAVMAVPMRSSFLGTPVSTQTPPSPLLRGSSVGLQPARQRTIVTATAKPETVAKKRLLPLRDWRLGLRSVPHEQLSKVPLIPSKGEIPRDLVGTLFRNGPGQFAVQGTPLKNMFDGDGLVHAFDFNEGRVEYHNRFVETSTRQEEAKAGKMLYGGLGHLPPHGFLDRLRNRAIRRPANTNVVVHGDAVFALNEGDWPYRINPKTLETEGIDNLGVLKTEQLFSAHPKLHRQTGDMWNVGIEYGGDLKSRGVVTYLNLYRREEAGTTERLTRVKVPFPAGMVHDFCLTERKAVIIVSPLSISRLMDMALCRIAPIDALEWTPEKGTHIAIIDLETGKTEWTTTDPMVVFHVSNGWDTPDGGVAVDIATYPDNSVGNVVSDVIAGQQPLLNPADLTRLEISSSGTVKHSLVSSVGVDFPRVAPMVASRPNKFIYGTTWDENSPFPDIPVCIDTASGQAVTRPMQRPGAYAGEVIPVPKANARTEQDVWLLTVVLNAAEERSELRIYDGADPHADATCVIPLPELVPFGFHGNWSSQRFGDKPTAVN